MRLSRRDFLQLSGTFFASATLVGLSGCGDNGQSVPDGGGADATPDAPPSGSVLFPQGVASGDPREASVVLWVRAVPVADGGPVGLTVEVATDPAFTTVVVRQDVQATAASDHTVRVVVTGLAADTAYHYRFVSGGDEIAGRTRTAPAAGADVPIRLAWVSCQDYSAGTYAAYRQLIADDDARPETDRIRFVLHLGDFVSETRGDALQQALDADMQAIALNNSDGSPRQIGPFPSGGGSVAGRAFAQTIDDYRHLYRTFAADPDLRAARARWPFIHVWDDRELAQDSWQSQANYSDVDSLEEPSQRRKLAANQAWFEHTPCQLSGSPGVSGVIQRATDFAPATVADAPFTPPNPDNFVDEPNNVAAVGSATIYRSFRFGRHVELMVTDERSYRSDHAVPEEFAGASANYYDRRHLVSSQDVAVMDAGMTANGNNPPVTVAGLPNPRRQSPPGTILGAAQKQWWKESMRLSDATWKIWGNQVPITRLFIRRASIAELIEDRVLEVDAWDGYPTERKELTTYAGSQGVANLLVLSAGLHAHLAGVVLDDYLSTGPTPVGVEFCAAGISANSLFAFYERVTRGLAFSDSLRALFTFDHSAAGGPAFGENLNMLLLHGAESAALMYQTNDLAQALAASDFANAHLRYADTNAQGFGVALITAAQAAVTLTTIERPVTNGLVAVKRTASFVVPADNPGGITGPVFTGTPPLPFA